MSTVGDEGKGFPRTIPYLNVSQDCTSNTPPTTQIPTAHALA